MRIGASVAGALALGVAVLAFTGFFEPPGVALDLGAPELRASRGDDVGERQASQGGGHTDGPVTYSTDPPTSGRHSPATVDWGVRDDRAPNERVTHNLEHGGIVIGYRDLPAADVERLKGVVRTLRRSGYPKILLEPYPQLGPDVRVAAAAWGWLLRQGSYGEAELIRFVRARYAGADAPEPNAP